MSIDKSLLADIIQDLIQNEIQKSQALKCIASEQNGSDFFSKMSEDKYKLLLEQLEACLNDETKSKLFNGSVYATSESGFTSKQISDVLEKAASSNFTESNHAIWNLLGYLEKLSKYILLKEKGTIDNLNELYSEPSKLLHPHIYLGMMDQYLKLISNVSVVHPERGIGNIDGMIKKGLELVQFLETKRNDQKLFDILFNNCEVAFKNLKEKIHLVVKDSNKRLNEKNVQKKIKIEVLQNVETNILNFKDLLPSNPVAIGRNDSRTLDATKFYKKIKELKVEIPPELILAESLGLLQLHVEWTKSCSPYEKEKPQPPGYEFTHVRFKDFKNLYTFSISIQHNAQHLIVLDFKYLHEGEERLKVDTIRLAHDPEFWNNRAEYSRTQDYSKNLENCKKYALEAIQKKLQESRQAIITDLLDTHKTIGSEFEQCLMELQASFLAIKSFLIIAGYPYIHEVATTLWNKELVINKIKNILLKNSSSSEFDDFFNEMDYLLKYKYDPMKDKILKTLSDYDTKSIVEKSISHILFFAENQKNILKKDQDGMGILFLLGKYKTSQQNSESTSLSDSNIKYLK